MSWQGPEVVSHYLLEATEWGSANLDSLARIALLLTSVYDNGCAISQTTEITA